VKVLRTPDERFRDLPGYSFAPHYAEVDGLRMHYVDEGPSQADPVLLLHGEPTWSYLYREIIPKIAAAGHRVVAPDLIGFGRSDKPTQRRDYSYGRHVGWVRGLLEALDLQRITLVCQDWGGLIGLRVAAENEARFARIVAANTSLPLGGGRPNPTFVIWRLFSQLTPVFRAGLVVRLGCARPLPREIARAYDAPFPSRRYMAGPLQFPLLVPTSMRDPAVPANRRAWEVLSRWEKPFLTAFSDGDAITRGNDARFQAHVPGARSQPHVTIKGGGHFLQEDRGEELARVVVEFIARS